MKELTYEEENLLLERNKELTKDLADEKKRELANEYEGGVEE